MKKRFMPMLLALAVSSVYAEQAINYTYNTKGQVTSVDGRRTDVQDITKYSYNNQNQLEKITNALGHTITYSNYDANGNPKIITNENGIATTLTYTYEGWLATITTAGATTTFTYDAIGQLTKVTLPDNSWLSYTWDNAKRLTTITNNLGESIHYTLDVMGNHIEEQTKKGTAVTQQLKRQFDELGRVTKVIGAAGQVQQYTYTKFNKVESETDPLDTTIIHDYYLNTGLVFQDYYKDNSSKKTQYNYNAFREETKIYDINGGRTQYEYDALGQLKIEEKPFKAYTKFYYQYDDTGNAIEYIDGNGHITHFRYDALNRTVKQRYLADENLTVSYQYDQPVAGYYNIGQLTTVRDQSGITNYNYNNQGLVAQQKSQLMLDQAALGAQQVNSYTYDKVGRIATANLGTVTFKYTRNTGGQITAVNLTKGSVNSTIATNITYQPFGGVTGLTWGNGIVLARNYNLDGQLTKQQIGTVTSNYQYDLNGNITQIADSQFGTTNYQYDKENRLIKEQNSTTTNYTYDIAGNRLTRENDKGKQQLYFLQGNSINDPYNKLTDNASNMLTYLDPTKHYQYDASNRFSKAIKKQGNKETELARYIHNANGERVIKVKEDGSISTFMYNDQGQLVNETQYTNSKQKTKEIYWVWVDTMPLAQVEIPFANNVAGTHTINYLHTDHLNTPRWATNQSKQKVWSWNSDGYGNILANEDPLNTGNKTTIPLRFPGQYFDSETRLHYNYFRTYDPDLGRYTQPDPIGLEGGWNMFTYVDGNPLRGSDPDGLQTKVQCYGFWCIITFPPPFPAGGGVLGGGAYPGGSLEGDPWGGMYPGNPPSGWRLPSFEEICINLVIRPMLPWILSSESDTGYKTPISGGTGKEKANDTPSWVQGQRPKIGESGKEFADRLMTEKYGAGNYNKGSGEYNKIKKYGDRNFK